MEAAIVGVISRIAPLLFGFLHGKYKLVKELEEDIRSITYEFEMVSATIKEAGDDPRRSGGEVHMTWIKMVRDLARDIEDCVDHFTHGHGLHKISKLSRLEFAGEIKKLKKRSEEARQQKKTYSTVDKEGAGGSGGEAKANTHTGAYTAKPVGMDAARRELMELISDTPQDQPKKLKVISIVGFGGIGKSQLADYAYNTIGESEYPEKAWVHAAGKDEGDVLKEIHRQLRRNSTTSSSSGEPERGFDGLRKLRASLKEYLDNKRFFIVIDDLRISWDDIKDAFPVDSGVSSRVIVTTATHSIATKCSNLNGHVYVMRTLDDKTSRKLFFEKADLHIYPKPDDTKLGSEVIEKCDGLPLALVTTARVLSGNPRKDQWADLGKNLAEYMEDKDELASMQHVLDRSYTSLSSQEIKTCLLYIGIYPSGYPIRSGSLIRKWLAEGLINQSNTKHSSLEVAVGNFSELVNQSIIHPIIDVSSSNNSAVAKTCQTHGMILEFILRKSMCQEFVTLLYGKDMPNTRHSKSKSKVRWLSVQHNARCKIDQEDLRLVRSLTIFGKAHKSMLDFSKYKLLKVLDLEKCEVQIGESHLKNICSNLVLLRYLSLGPKVNATALPNEIKMLILLETLDLRKTKIEILPAQIMLPCIVHLFGKLKLQKDRRSSIISKFNGDPTMREVQAWLSENSKLETLARFDVDERQEMPQLIEHMKELSKVKIWCGSTPRGPSRDKINHLRKAIKGFIERGSRDNPPSLSLHFDTEWHQDVVYLKIKTDRIYYLRSLKLQGNNICSILPSFITMLGGLTKLCLSFPGQKMSTEFLDALRKVRCLGYLKLVASELGKLVLREDATKMLRRLCVVAEVVTGLEIEKGALPCLESLGLLCKDLNGFKYGTIQSMPLLKEVTLHNGLSKDTKQEWTKAARNHPRRPKVLFAETDHKRSKSAVEIRFVAPATDTTAEGVSLPANDIRTEESDVTSEIASEPVTATGALVSTNYSIIANAQKENNGNGQHDDREKKCTDKADDSKEFATENGCTTAESDEVELKDDQQMKDDTRINKPIKAFCKEPPSERSNVNDTSSVILGASPLPKTRAMSPTSVITSTSKLKKE